MDTASRLDEIKKQLSPDQLRYLNERVYTRTDAEAARNCGIYPQTVYNWPEKTLVQEALNLMLSDGLAVSLDILRRSLAKAARVKAAGLDSKKPVIAQAAATEILDRFHGRPVQQNNINFPGGPLVVNMTWGDTEAESGGADNPAS